MQQLSQQRDIVAAPGRFDSVNTDSYSHANGGEWSGASDEALLRRMADAAARSAGDDGAFDELFARHSALLLSFIARLTAGKYDAEDLLQETFLRVITHACDYRPGAAIRPWLFTIARNVTLNALKKTRLRADLEVQTDLSDWTPPSPDQSGDPSKRAELQEEKARMLDALQDLPTLHREILILIVFNSFSYEEAAAITGDPESTLRSRVFHALRKLRDRLKEAH